MREALSPGTCVSVARLRPVPDPVRCAWQLYFIWDLSSLASGRGVYECEVPGREEGRETRVVWYARAAAGKGMWGAHRRESEHSAVPTRDGGFCSALSSFGCLVASPAMFGRPALLSWLRSRSSLRGAFF